jgi:predicted AAA+ superfamily ATPase
METRYIQRPVEADVRKKMVFLGGPRQAGKTTLARAILARIMPVLPPFRVARLVGFRHGR